MDSREHKESGVKLLRKALGGSAGPCPDSGTFAAYFERSLGAQETARYELHFSQCARCREQLAAMARANDDASAATPAPRSSPWAWFWNWRLLAPVMTILIIAAIWIGRRPAAIVTVQEPSPVALSQAPQPPADFYDNENTPAPAPAPSAVPPKVAAKSKSELDALRKQSTLAAARDLTKERDEKKDSPVSAGLTDAAPKSIESRISNERARDSETASRSVNAISSSPAAAPPPAVAANTAPVLEPTAPPAGTMAVEANKPKTSPQLALSASGQPARAGYSGAVMQMRLSGGLIATPDPKVQWRIGEAGFVERTTDGGVSWQGQQPDENAQLVAGSAPSTEACWLVGNGGVILVTKDAKNWKRIAPPVNADFTSVVARSDSAATVTTSDGHSFTTTDGGAHWITAE